MDEQKAKNAIVEVLQRALKGKLQIEDAGINLSYIAESILFELDFAKNSKDMMKDALLNSLASKVVSLHKEMDTELSNSKEEEKLLRNFLHGKIESYLELLNIIKTA